jgi:hypothetical protein
VSGLAAQRFRPVPEAEPSGTVDTGGMKVSYGIRWRVVSREQSGRLSVGESGLAIVDAYDAGVREIPYDEILEIAVHETGEGLARLDVWLVDGGRIECETSVASWILDALEGRAPVVEEHELHAGLGL